MAYAPDEGNQARANNARRQAYYRNRRTVAKMVDGKRRVLETERMEHAALVKHLEANLLTLYHHHAEGSSPRLYSAALQALECFQEMMVRGDQLRMF